MFVGDTEFWRHSTLWLEWAEQDRSIYHNPLYNTTEIFIKRSSLCRPAGHGNENQIKDYFPNE